MMLGSMWYAYLTALLWGITSVLYAELLKVFSPMFLFLLHGTLFSWMSTYVYYKEGKKIMNALSNRMYLLFAIFTLATVIITQYLFYKSLENSKGNVIYKNIAIAYTAPIISMFILWIFQKERMNIYSWLGVTLTVSGVLILALQN